MIRVTLENGKQTFVGAGHKLIGVLLDREFNIGIGNGTQRAILANHTLNDTGQLKLVKTKVLLEKVDEVN